MVRAAAVPAGVTLLAAALVVFVTARDGEDRWRAQELAMAGSAVVLVGFGIGMYVAWRIAHPRPEESEEEGNTRPPVD